MVKKMQEFSQQEYNMLREKGILSLCKVSLLQVDVPRKNKNIQQIFAYTYLTLARHCCLYMQILQKHFPSV